jgi:hypothetical protein
MAFKDLIGSQIYHPLRQNKKWPFVFFCFRFLQTSWWNMTLLLISNWYLVYVGEKRIFRSISLDWIVRSQVASGISASLTMDAIHFYEYPVKMYVVSSAKRGHRGKERTAPWLIGFMHPRLQHYWLGPYKHHLKIESGQRDMCIMSFGSKSMSYPVRNGDFEERIVQHHD